MKQKPNKKKGIVPKVKVRAAKGFRPMKLKNIFSLLGNLPAELRRLAIANADNEHSSKDWRKQVPTVQQGSYALAAAFDWTKSVEGEEFWKHVHSKLIERENHRLCISPN